MSKTFPVCLLVQFTTVQHCEKMEEERPSNSKSHKLWVTALINISFIFLVQHIFFTRFHLQLHEHINFFQGLQDCVQGPTLLDMTGLYKTQVKVITIVIVLKAIGSIVGASLGM